MVFFDEPVTLQWSGNTITVLETYTGWVRAAVAASPAAEEVLPIYKVRKGIC